MNQSSQDRLKLVWPVLAENIYQLSTALIHEGIYIAVVQGLRTVEEQDALYAQGRTAPGKIVTNARGGQSWHNFGLAVDCAPVNPYASIDWNASHPQWKRMEELGVSLGLTSGARWAHLPDAPHFQLTGAWPEAEPTDEVRELCAQGGLKAVWDALEAQVPGGPSELAIKGQQPVSE